MSASVGISSLTKWSGASEICDVWKGDLLSVFRGDVFLHK